MGARRIETAQADAVVIGGGAVGLACARALAAAGRTPVVLEAADVVGAGTSSRSSEVIHAGLYYPPGSVKARTCVAGRRRLNRYLDARGVARRACGKLVVARGAAEVAAMEAIEERARTNGVEDLALLDGSAARALEPALAPEIDAALFSPATGVFDSHGFLQALAADVEAAGGTIVRRAPVVGGRADPDGLAIEVAGGAPYRVVARSVINAAGLFAGEIARALDGPASSKVPPLRFARGVYFTCAAPAPFTRLIYPVPEAGGLGAHLTVDTAGRARFGPDVEWLETRDPAALRYDVDPKRGIAMEASVRRYWPGLPGGALRPDYAGVRPKLSAPGARPADFMIQGPSDHGTPGLVHLYGIESPGLTAALALADEAVAALDPAVAA